MKKLLSLFLVFFQLWLPLAAAAQTNTRANNGTFTGNVSTAGITTDTGGLNVGKVIRDCRTDNVKCDGTTDDSAAITACLVNAYAAGQGAAQLPSGQCKANTTINDTNKPSLDVYGSNSNEDFSTVTSGQNFGTTVTEIICNTGATPCWDATGTGRARLKRFGLRAAIGQTAPSQIGFLFGRDNAVSGTGWITGTGTYCFPEENKLEDVWVFFDTRPAATAVGTVAIYNQGAEEFQIIGGGYIADQTVMFGFSNILSIASPFVTLGTGCPLSMSEVKIGHGASFQPWTKQAIRIDDQMIDFETEADTEFINPNIGTNHNATVLINTSNANNIFLRGQSESFDLPLAIGGTIDRLRAEMTAVSPTAGLVQFTTNNIGLTNSLLSMPQRNLAAQPLFNAASGTGITIKGSDLYEGTLSGSGTASNITVTQSRIMAQGLADAAVNTFSATSSYDLADDTGRSFVNLGTSQHYPIAIALHSTYTNATTTFSNISDGTRTMSWPILANADYKLSCDFTWQGSANTTGPKFQITGPAAPTLVGVNLDSAVTATTSIYAAATAFSSAVANTGTVTITTNFPAQLTANIANGANAGTLVVQAAANGAGTLTIGSGSCQLQ